MSRSEICPRCDPPMGTVEEILHNDLHGLQKTFARWIPHFWEAINLYQKTLLLHNNVSPQKAKVIVCYLHEQNVHILTHKPCSPDFAPMQHLIFVNIEAETGRAESTGHCPHPHTINDNVPEIWWSQLKLCLARQGGCIFVHVLQPKCHQKWYTLAYRRQERERGGKQNQKMYVLHSLVGGEVGEGLQSQKHIDMHLTVVPNNENWQFNLMCPASWDIGL